MHANGEGVSHVFNSKCKDSVAHRCVHGVFVEKHEARVPGKEGVREKFGRSSRAL